MREWVQISVLLSLGGSSEITLNGAISTQGAVTLTGPVSLATAPISIDTNATAGITFTSTINGAQTLTLNSSGYPLSITGVVGGVTPLTEFTITDASTFTLTSGSIDTGKFTSSKFKQTGGFNKFEPGADIDSLDNADQITDDQEGFTTRTPIKIAKSYLALKLTEIIDSTERGGNIFIDFDRGVTLEIDSSLSTRIDDLELLSTIFDNFEFTLSKNDNNLFNDLDFNSAADFYNKIELSKLTKPNSVKNKLFS